MAAYKDKVRQDLDRWIASGLVAPDKREAILATLPDARRLDAATALAWVGATLLGIAIIAFIAARKRRHRRRPQRAHFLPPKVIAYGVLENALKQHRQLGERSSRIFFRELHHRVLHGIERDLLVACREERLLVCAAFDCG